MTNDRSASTQADDEPIRTQVLIVGGGPVGLALAMELNFRGISCMIVDPRAEVTPFRKANGCNSRTFEHFRRWGVADEIRSEAPLPGDWSDDILFMTSFTGYVLGSLKGVKHGVGRMDESPENFQRVPQWVIERTLRRHLDRNDLTTTVWGSKVVGHRPEPGGGALATLQDSKGIESEVSARYVVGCDGTRSVIRRDLGVELEDETTYSLNANITLRSTQLGELHHKERAVHYWYMNSDVSGHFSPQDLAGTWLLTSTWLDESKDPDIEALIERAIGLSVDYEIIDSSVWWANSYVAKTYRKRDSFLCGDALHVHPPSGGYGMNQGIHDAVDLGWKLAATISGWGGPGLLESYERERKPVNRQYVNEAVDSWKRVGRQLAVPGLELKGAEYDRLREEVGNELCATRAKQFDSLGLILGYQYLESPITVSDGTDPVLSTVSEYRQSARPGARAPHAWLDDGSSLYDEFGPYFTLLDLGAEHDRVAEFVSAAKSWGVPLNVVKVTLESVRESYSSTLALIRPDQHVAWREGVAHEDAHTVLSIVTGQRPSSTVQGRVD